ncbi:MAG: M14 family zinc carboxypeptidase [Ignavibacteriaceae bacterium]
MRKILIGIIILLAVNVLHSQNFKQVSLALSNPETDIPELTQLDFDLEHSVLTKEKKLIFFVSDDEFARLALLKYPVEVLIDDWFEYYSKLPKLSQEEINLLRSQSKEEHGVEGFGFGSMGGHYTYQEAMAQLDSMRLRFPNLITVKQAIGFSVENRPVYMVKISDNPDMNEDEPEALYTGLTHAREPAGMMAVIYFMYHLLETYATNPSTKYLVDNRQLYFIPVCNPDGYEYNRTTNPSGGGMWRKNRRNNGGSFGIDLNRNYGPDAYWNAPNGGSSTDPSSDTYRGPTPFSEPETQGIRNFVTGKNIKTSLFYHTYSNLLIYPYGALGRETPDSLIFREFASDMVSFHGYEAGTDLQTVGYSTRGNSDDFLYDGDPGRGKIFSMTPELGGSSDGFWAPQSRIYPIVMENLGPNLYYSWVAGEYIKLNSYSFDRQYFNPGDAPKLYVQLKNKGLSTGRNLEVQAISFSQYAMVQLGGVYIDSVSARSNYNLPSPFNLDILPGAPIGEEIKLGVKVLINGVQMSLDTIKIIIGTPMFVFSDSTNNPATKWTITSTPTTPQWGVTTTTFNSAPNSYTDSPTGNYVASATVTMTLKDPVNLTGMTRPVLSFWTKYDLESNWDYGQVKISTNNGTSWTPLAGQYTEPGQGTFQPAGEPLYDGLRSNWVREDIDLATYTGKQIKLMYQLRSDGSIHKDGWYVDDIGIYMYAAVPVELTSFTAMETTAGILLSWSTATETNNKGFEIERKNFNTGWDVIGAVEGSGTTADKSDYSFTDNKPVSGINSYRLKQIDFDGTFRIYNSVEVEFSGITEYSLVQNYPNPFNPSTVISYQLPKESRVNLKIFDILGNEVAELLNEEKAAGKYTYELSITNYELSSGVYFYKLQAGDFISTKKMMILK